MVGQATVTGGLLNLRADSDVKSTRLASIPSGTVISVIEKGSVWCKVTYNEFTGYVMTQYLKFESDGGNDKVTLTLSRSCAKALYDALKLSLNL